MHPILEHARRRSWLFAGGRPVEVPDLERRIAACSRDLRGAGAAERHVVALRGSNSIDLLAAVLAVWELDGVPLLLHPRFPPGLVERTVREARASVILEIDAARAPAAARRLEAPQPLVAPPHIATILCTSGTSTLPKLVAHTWENHVASADGVIAALGDLERARWLLALPLCHVGGLAILVRMLRAGGHVALAGSETSLREALAITGASHVSLVATQLKRLLVEERGARALERLGAAILGGGPVPADLRRRCVDLRAPVWVSYGTTEAASAVTACRDPACVATAESAGRALPGRDVALAACGEIRLGGPTIAAGRLVEGSLVGLLEEDGRYPTGDVGAFDASGVLLIRGRKDAMFVSGGENVHPEEIEEALLALEGIGAAVVVAVPDEEFGARPVAFIESAGTVTEEALRGALAERLPGFKIPRAFYRFPEPTGPKPARHVLAALAADARERARLPRP